MKTRKQFIFTSIEESEIIGFVGGLPFEIVVQPDSTVTANIIYTENKSEIKSGFSTLLEGLAWVAK